MSKYLCDLAKKGLLQDDRAAYKDLVRDPRVLCKKCGRVAKKAKHLCKPEKL